MKNKGRTSMCTIEYTRGLEAVERRKQGDGERERKRDESVLSAVKKKKKKENRIRVVRRDLPEWAFSFSILFFLFSSFFPQFPSYPENRRGVRMKSNSWWYEEKRYIYVYKKKKLAKSLWNNNLAIRVDNQTSMLFPFYFLSSFIIYESRFSILASSHLLFLSKNPWFCLFSTTLLIGNKSGDTQKWEFVFYLPRK